MSEWISVEKALPDDFIPVLLCIPSQSPMPTVREGYRVNGAWMCQSLFGMLEPWYDTVTHWMPLPDPPEGENE